MKYKGGGSYDPDVDRGDLRGRYVFFWFNRGLAMGGCPHEIAVIGKFAQKNELERQNLRRLMASKFNYF